MTERAIKAVGLTICLLLACQRVLAADSPGAARAIDQPDFTQDSPAGESPAFETWPNQMPTPGPAGDQPSYPGASGQEPAWNQPRFNEGQMEQRPGMPEADDSPDDFTRERERPRLQAPPPSVQPRRDGAAGRQWRRPQIGPRRFAPTPDFNGRGSPFDFERPPEDRLDREL